MVLEQNVEAMTSVVRVPAARLPRAIRQLKLVPSSRIAEGSRASHFAQAGPIAVCRLIWPEILLLPPIKPISIRSITFYCILIL